MSKQRSTLWKRDKIRILKKAKKLLTTKYTNNNGDTVTGWFKGGQYRRQLVGFDQHGNRVYADQFCLNGALNEAARTTLNDQQKAVLGMAGWTSPGDFYAASIRAASAVSLETQIRQDKHVRASYNFNDRASTKLEDVIAAIDKRIATLEKGED